MFVLMILMCEVRWLFLERVRDLDVKVIIFGECLMRVMLVWRRCDVMVRLVVLVFVFRLVIFRCFLFVIMVVRSIVFMFE